jgi:AmiR/NasT family two-component response regulator
VTGGDDAAALAEARSQLAAARTRADHLQLAVVSNRRIGMALGILMATRRLTEEQAFDHLRAVSQQRNVKLRELAEQVIYTGDVDQRQQ